MDREILLVFIANTLFTAVSGLLHISLPLYIAKTLGFSQGAYETGYVLSIASILSIVSQVVWGYLSDLFKDRLRITFIGSALSLTLYSIALIFSKNFEIVKYTYILSPIGGGAISVTLYTFTADIGMKSLGKSMSLFWSGASLGWALTVAFTGSIVEFLGVSGVYAVALMLTTIGLSMVILLMRISKNLNNDYTGGGASLKVFIKLLKNRYFITLYIASSAFLVGDIVKNIFITQYMAYCLGFGESIATAILSIASFSEIPVFIFIANNVLKKIGSSTTLYLSILSMSLYLYLFSKAVNIYEAAILMIFYSIPWTMYALSISVLTPLTVDKECRGTALALINTNYTLIGATLSTLIGSAISTLGYRTTFIIIAIAITVVGTALLPTVYPLKNRYT